MVATATGIRLSAAAAARSATHQPLLEMDADGLAELPADAATIAVVAAWMERLVTDDAADAELVAQLAAQPARFAAALELANYLQLEPLVATLLGSIGADGGTGLLRACMASVAARPAVDEGDEARGGRREGRGAARRGACLRRRRDRQAIDGRRVPRCRSEIRCVFGRGFAICINDCTCTGSQQGGEEI